MARIELTQGQCAIIDDDDLPAVSAYNWFALWNGHTKSFYAVAHAPTVNGKRPAVRMHRLVTGATTGSIVDHINHDTLDNRKENLRVCSVLGNAQNARLRSDNKSGYKGVSWVKDYRRWATHISSKGGRSAWVIMKTRLMLPLFMITLR